VEPGTGAVRREGAPARVREASTTRARSDRGRPDDQLALAIGKEA
jgi:hypothetical protein